MSIRPQAFESLVKAISQFPTIGPKTAARIALWLLSKPQSVSEEIGKTLIEARAQIRPCSVCYQFTDAEVCEICSDVSRDRSLICAVETSVDVWNFERTKQFKGLYHVLGGALSPIDGIGHDELKIDSLIDRIKKSDPPVAEIILATDPDTEGNATAYYISELLSGFNIKKTRLAHGIPIGGEVAYSDDATLSAALIERKLIG
ncbi:MAG: recombination protein RecR [Candidatus Hydrogenedentes bacterium CG07_land_8_20_14_0_80_42_17]|nr:MAG: recombination protein RecR [Candidatus Hydrogenedentes bacterium CG07_land_8_20_14_0_80_42_17]